MSRTSKITKERQATRGRKKTKVALTHTSSTEWLEPFFDLTTTSDDVTDVHDQTSSASVGQSRSRNRKLPSKKSSQVATKSSRHGERGKRCDMSGLWLTTYAPTCEQELAVHRKKLDELRDWIRRHCCSVDRLHAGLRPGQPSVLLLTGPAGCGKSTALKLVARQLGVHVQEWSDSVNQHMTSRSQFGSDVRTSQLAAFRDFLFRAERYSSLQFLTGTQDPGSSSSPQKVVFIDDLPNVFYRDPSALQEMLAEYAQPAGTGTAANPLVFVLSDSPSSELNPSRIFASLSRSSAAQLCVDTISFNPISQTAMLKALRRVVQLAQDHGAVEAVGEVQKDQLESLASASTGDLRSAINTLQFSCASDFPKSSRANNRSETHRIRADLSKDTRKPLNDPSGRDFSLYMFRALGKVLYAKRVVEESGTSPNKDELPLPPHLSHHYRGLLTFNPESILEQCQMEPAVFGAFLHQNFLDFYGEIRDLSTCSEYMSFADHLLHDFESQTQQRSHLQAISGMLTVRAVVFCDRAREGRPSSGWRPLYKPRLFEADRLCRERAARMQYTFPEHCTNERDLLLDVMPLLGQTGVTLRNPTQISFLDDFNSSFENRSGLHSSFSPRERRMEEKEVVGGAHGTEDCEPISLPEGISSSQSEPPIDPADGFVIEEFEDDF